jgi:predicted TIM-barrel fold metal-dependent hydrolase
MVEFTNDHSPARRSILAGLAALGAASGLGAATANAQPAKPAQPYRIDVHHHLVPPGYLDAVGAVRRGGEGVHWSPERSIEDMDKSGIAVSMISLVQPGVWFNDVDKGRRLSRESNEYAAKLARDYPGRFGSFATIPLPDVDGSLKEIDYAFGTLKADGVGLMTSYGDKYLGDAAFAPVWEELNRRKAVVYTHPLTPDCCRNTFKGFSPGVVEYTADTTRTVASIVFSGTAARYPDIKWVFSHSGGTVPFLLSRFTRQESDMKERAKEVMPKGVMYELRKFHYDTAQGNHPGALSALMKMVPVKQVLFGTDFPFRPGAEEIHGLSAYFKGKDLHAIERDNALRLLPTVKA